MRNYLLRFEEQPVQCRLASNAGCAQGTADSGGIVSTIAAGTETFTEVKKEGMDADPHVAGFSAFPK
jgi:hypothetical protein